MAWPSTNKKRLTYLLVAPILFPLWLTLPDTKTPRGKKFYPVTFIGSIVWIAAYSYLMVWWANVAGETAKIPPEVSTERRFIAVASTAGCLVIARTVIDTLVFCRSWD